uniref:Immunoglobulin V-set domain-containing protein n=1 Tax=Strix occidentalis caurina TaxID=311401 RepID=A0A8D0KXU0_STROC
MRSDKKQQKEVCRDKQLSHAQKDSVLQFPTEMTIRGGQSTTLNCNFSTSYANPYIFWYQQHQTQSPQMLLQVDKWTAQVNSGRLSSALVTFTAASRSRVFDDEKSPRNVTWGLTPYTRQTRLVNALCLRNIPGTLE